MEDSNQKPEDSNSIESSSTNKQDNNKEQNVNEFTESLENPNNQGVTGEKVNIDLKDEKLETKKDSLFKRILNDGFDGISSNPNYKMLAL